MKSPNLTRSTKSVWRSGVAEQHPLTVSDLYARKFPIAASDCGHGRDENEAVCEDALPEAFS